jgi:hypothetical protein
MLAGAALFNHGSQTDTGVALGVRLQGLEADHTSKPWSLELGGTLPHHPPTGFQQDTATSESSIVRARVSGLAELHLEAHYELPHGRQGWVVPQVGFGASMLRIRNTNDAHFFAFGSTFDDTSDVSNTSFSPLISAGVDLFTQSRVGAALEIACGQYANTFSANQTFDMPLNGCMVRTMMQVRL